MRPTPIPDDEVWPGAARAVLSGPSGDLTDTDVGPVEVLFDRCPTTDRARAMLRIVPEGDDLEKLAAGGVIWLGVYGPMPVFTVDVKAPGE